MFFLVSCQNQLDPREQAYRWPAPDPDSPLIGTRWINTDWGEQIIYFEDAETVVFDGNTYAYTYDKAKLRGQADYLGGFTVTEDYQRMNFSNWTIYNHSVIFTRFL